MEGGIGGVREAKGEDGEGGGQWERMGGGGGMVEIRRVSKLPYEAT